MKFIKFLRVALDLWIRAASLIYTVCSWSSRHGLVAFSAFCPERHCMLLQYFYVFSLLSVLLSVFRIPATNKLRLWAAMQDRAFISYTRSSVFHAASESGVKNSDNHRTRCGCHWVLQVSHIAAVRFIQLLLGRCPKKMSLQLQKLARWHLRFSNWENSPLMWTFPVAFGDGNQSFSPIIAPRPNGIRPYLQVERWDSRS